MNKELAKQEAIERMKKLDMWEPAIEAFKNGILTYSINGIVYTLEREYVNIIREWEEQTNNIAYHIIYDESFFGNLLSILYVSEKPEEWQNENYFLDMLFPMSYVINLSNPHFSEFGRIVIKPFFGGIKRKI